jgi:hypothetical protein
MKKTEDILNDFSDYEIAVFKKHKLSEYLESTQKSIRNYIIDTRGLSDDKINELYTHVPELNKADKRVHCPRCKSYKLIVTRVKWNIPAFRAGYEDEAASWKEITTGKATYKDKVECFVCGHVLYDPNNEKRPFYKRMLDIFFDQPLPI